MEIKDIIKKSLDILSDRLIKVEMERKNNNEESSIDAAIEYTRITNTNFFK